MNFIKLFSLIAAILLCLITTSSGQITLTGKLINSKSKEAIPYVNIGVLGESVGTVSDISGKFELQIPDELKNSKIVFSAIGYEDYSGSPVQIFEFLNTKTTISMQPIAYEMEEIVVSKYKLKSKTLGNKVTKTNVQAGYKDNILGCEVATKIKVKKKEQVLLDKFKFHIASNVCDSLFFRLNFYTNDRGKPGKNITKQNIFITSNIESGIVEIDLSKYEIWMQEDFFVGLEWIRNFCPEQEKGGFNFASRFFKKLHYRPAGQADWSKLNVAGVGMWLDVLYCRKDL